MGDEAPAAVDPSEADGAPDKPEIEFNAAEHELVVDIKALCAIPFDSEASAVESLRAFRFAKGKAMHGPEAGSYAVAGEYSVLNTFVLVHFQPSKKRKPELVLSFADYGMASATMTGQYICSLALPLMKRKNFYENTIRYTSVVEIAGFSQINEGQAPWSIHLAPALQKLGGPHCTFKLFKSAEVQAYVEKPLVEKIKDCHSLAKESLSAHLEGLRRQDKNLAEKQGAVYNSQLQKTVDWLMGLPPPSYDVPLSTRLITVNEEGVAARPDSWVTPSKAGSLVAAEVQSTRFERTAKCAKKSLEVALADVPEPVAEPQLQGGAEALELSGDGEGMEAQAEGKRARKSPEMFEFSKPTSSRKKKTAQKAKDLLEINPRTGKPWVRGPYDTGKKFQPASMLAGAMDAKPAPELLAPAPGSVSDRETIAKLKLKIAELEAEVKQARAELDHQKSSMELCITNAQLKMQHEMDLKVMQHYQKGLVDGVNLSRGQAPSASSSSDVSSPAFSASGASVLSRF